MSKFSTPKINKKFTYLEQLDENLSSNDFSLETSKIIKSSILGKKKEENKSLSNFSIKNIKNNYEIENKNTNINTNNNTFSNGLLSKSPFKKTNELSLITGKNKIK
jgi:hypothetical protein